MNDKSGARAIHVTWIFTTNDKSEARKEVTSQGCSIAVLFCDAQLNHNVNLHMLTHRLC